MIGQDLTADAEVFGQLGRVPATSAEMEQNSRPRRVRESMTESGQG